MLGQNDHNVWSWGVKLSLNTRCWPRIKTLFRSHNSVIFSVPIGLLQGSSEGHTQKDCGWIFHVFTRCSFLSCLWICSMDCGHFDCNFSCCWYILLILLLTGLNYFVNFLQYMFLENLTLFCSRSCFLFIYVVIWLDFISFRSVVCNAHEALDPVWFYSVSMPVM